MFYRAATLAITAFWLLMMALLVRVQFFADTGNLLPVPPEYVWKLIFQHEQPSNLTVYSQQQRIGSVQLEPKHAASGPGGSGGPVRLLNGSATLPLSLPGLNTQNVTARWSLQMNGQNTVEFIGLNASVHTPGQRAPGVTLVVDGYPVRDQWKYQIRSEGVNEHEGGGTAASILDELNLQFLGIDAKALLQLGQQQVAAVNVSARHGTLHSNGEDIEGYEVLIHHGELFDTTIFVSPLGQILAVHGFAGYDLFDETLAP